MQSEEVRKKFLDFFKSKGHKVLPSSSLIPDGDTSVLFTTAGMQQFKPYYTGAKDPVKDFGAKNVTTAQKCVRTGDIDEVGDDTHLTFFEMLGNFSFGGYWKREAIEYAYEFITKELGLEIDYVSVFKDDESGIDADEESREIWKSINPELKIKDHKKEDNFWGPTGDEGPCGPTTEIYINGVEIWNIVFNEYYKSKDGKYTPLETKGIDTGMGLERLLVQTQKKNNVFDLDVFEPSLDKIKELSRQILIPMVNHRVISDHMRASVFMASDGIQPSNTGRGYVLRRLIRRAVRFSDSLNIKPNSLFSIAETFQTVYKDIYPEVMVEGGTAVLKAINEEEIKFRQTLKEGIREFEKKYSGKEESKKTISGSEGFYFFTSYGIPKDVFLDLLKEKKGKDPNFEDRLELSESFESEYESEMEKHQALSRTASAGMFKGGLANHEEKTIKLHTAHHLLLAALQEIISPEIKQRGSNINEERLRIDFTCDHKLTDEEKRKVEEWVNDKVDRNLNVVRREMPLAEAEKIGAQMEFGAKYPDTVSVYFIEDKSGHAVSKEFCGGPHVLNTRELGKFKIQKEEAVAAGIRRIKAVLA